MHFKDEKNCLWLNTLVTEFTVIHCLYGSILSLPVVNYSVTCLFTHSCVFDCLFLYSTNKYILLFWIPPTDVFSTKNLSLGIFEFGFSILLFLAITLIDA